MKRGKKLDESILLVVNFLVCVYGRTYIQKLFFLIENELFKNMDLNYVKYHYGPFSRDLAVQVENLKDKGLIEEKISVSRGHKGHCYKLTKKGKLQAKQLLKTTNSKKLNVFCKRFKNYTPSELLRFVYSKYPEWTTNSLINNV